MKDLTEGKESKLILQFAAPMLLGNAFQVLYNFTDTIVVGRFIGEQALAAVGNSFPIIFVLVSLIIGFVLGSTIIISQYFGAKNYENVKRTIDTMNIVLFFTALVVSVSGVLFSEQIFRLVNLPETILPYATTYLNIIMGGSVFMFGFNGISAVLRGLGDSKTPLYFLIVSTVINIILDLTFVVGLDWGIEGVALATVLAQAIAFLTAVFYLNRNHDIIKISFRNVVFDKEIFKKSIRIGLPSGMQHVFVSLGFMALMAIVNMFGTNTIAAYSSAIRIDSFAGMPAMNFANALSTFVGQNIGANKPERVITGLRATLKMTCLTAVAFTAIAVLFGEELIMLFTDEKEVIEIGYQYLSIVSPFYIVFSIMFSVNAIFRGAGDTLIPMFITLFSLWLVRLPLAYFLSGEIGAAGIWWSSPISWIAGVIFSVIYYHTGKWKNKGVVSHKIPGK